MVTQRPYYDTFRKRSLPCETPGSEGLSWEVSGVTMRYTVVIDPDPDGGFTVTVPAIPAVVAEGDTEEEALANVREAIELALEVISERGDQFPVEAGELRLEHVDVAV